MQASSQGDKLDVTFSKEVLDAISKAEAERISGGKSDAERSQKEQDLSERMVSYMLASTAAYDMSRAQGQQ